jgi:hypothetical protein
MEKVPPPGAAPPPSSGALPPPPQAASISVAAAPSATIEAILDLLMVFPDLSLLDRPVGRDRLA